MKLPFLLSIVRIGLLVVVVAMTALFGAGPGGPTRVAADQDLGLPLFGVGLGTDPTASAPDYARDVGAGFASVHVDWTTLEPSQPAPDAPLDAAAIARFDTLISALASRGVVPVVGLGGAPPWAAPHRNGPLYPDKEAAYLAVLGKVIDRYKVPPYNVKHWLLWSEADAISTPPAALSDRGSWADEPARFANVMRSAYGAIKQREPGAVVIMGSLAHDWFYDPGPGCPNGAPCGGPEPGFNNGGIFKYRFLDLVLDSMLANGDSPAFDALGINSYITFAPGWEGDANRKGLPAWDVAAKVSHVRARLDRRGVHVPIFVGEAGYWSDGPAANWAYITDGKGNTTDQYGNPYGRVPATSQTQAEYVAKLYARARSAGAAAVAWFSLEEGPVDKHGLVDDGGTHKDSFRAYAWAVRAMGTPVRSMSSNAVLSTSQGTFESYAFSGGSNCGGNPCFTIVAWATGTTLSPTAVVAAAPELKAYDLYNKPVDAVGTDRGRYLFNLTSSPVFFQRDNYYSMLIPLTLRRAPSS